MYTREARRRLRRAVEIIAEEHPVEDREEVLWRAWEVLQGLGRDQFPEELRPNFDYLLHELSLRKGQELTAREVSFLLERIREIGESWTEPPVSATDTTSEPS